MSKYECPRCGECGRKYTSAMPSDFEEWSCPSCKHHWEPDLKPDNETDEKVLCVTLNGYQEMAAATAIYPQYRAIEYLALGMASEAGEVAGKVKKMIRDGGYFNEQLADETGDVLWYVSEMARQLGVTLEELASRNLRKLQSRQSRGVLGGSGDVR